MAGPPPSTRIAIGVRMKAHGVTGRGGVRAAGSQARRVRSVASSVSVLVRESQFWTVLEFEGELDQVARPLVAEVVASDTERYVFDLHAVTFMDARGLGMVIDTQRRALDAGGAVRLVAPSSAVRRVLTITGCCDYFRTFDTVHEAVMSPIDRDRRQAP